MYMRWFQCTVEFPKEHQDTTIIKMQSSFPGFFYYKEILSLKKICRELILDIVNWTFIESLLREKVIQQMLSVPHTTFLWLICGCLSYRYRGQCATGSFSSQGRWTTWSYRAVDMSDNLQPKVSGASREKFQPPDFTRTVLKGSFYKLFRVFPAELIPRCSWW